MIQTPSRRRAWPALLLALVVLAGAGTTALGAEPETSPESAASPGPETTAEPSGDPTPEPTAYPTFDPSAIRLRTDLFIDSLEAPVYLTDDGTGQKCLYVAERGGKVWMVDTDGYRRPTPFLDVSKLVTVGPEQGLHSIAFHPDFKKNGRFFVHYNAKLDGASVIAEYSGSPCKPANKKSAKVLLRVDQAFPNNNAGWIGFGPDGYLYIPLGDGGGISPGDPNGWGQTKSTPLSKVLRIDVDQGRRYGWPKTNPYEKKRKGFYRATFAWGLRDPRRASFDRETGDLWIGDVGQDSRPSEVNYIAQGSVPKNGPAPNFGWSHVEGESTCHANAPDCDPSQYVPPVWSYDQVAPHRAITGGYVYRGAEMSELQGVYIFGDFASGDIWGLDAGAVADGHPIVAQHLLDSPQGIVSFGEDDAGELYVLSLDGSVYRIGAEES
jgi:glucose/arabinose dehydrogenase